jgi:hypothetical protein
MVEKEYQPLLDRGTSIGHVQTHFADILKVIRDMVNYGSNLIPRCFVSSNRRLEDVIILGVLLRQSVTMFDAIEILLSNAAVYPCYLQTRAIFETSLYIEWILKEETEKKAKYYYVANVRQARMWASRTQRGSLENLAYENIMAPFGNVIQNTTDRLSADGLKDLQEINRVLTQLSFVAIDHDIDSYKIKNKFRYDPPWYAPIGPRSVRELAGILKRLHEYELIYVASSEVMHSTSQKHHIKFSQSHLELTPIRHLGGIDIVLRFSMATMMKIYLDVLGYYRSEEIPNFSRKYIEDWRQEFMSIQGVEYKNKNGKSIVI